MELYWPHSSEENQIAGYETVVSTRNQILHNFYRLMFEINEDASLETEANKWFETRSEINDHFQIDYFRLAIGYFYVFRDSLQPLPDYLWLKDCNRSIQIKIDEKSGSLFQSPFDTNLGMIYLGRHIEPSTEKGEETGKEKGDEKGYWFCCDQRKSLKYLTIFFFCRSEPLHYFKDKIFPYIRKEKSISQNIFVLNNVAEQIISGQISDAQIICKDGNLSVSKGVLSLYSDYFFTLFKQEKKAQYTLDQFHKDILIYYLYFCCNKPSYFNPNFIDDFFWFGDFIQDRKFMIHLYQQIYEHQSCYSNKSLIEMLKNFQEIGFEIKKY
jgi:hypothetical protein